MIKKNILRLGISGLRSSNKMTRIMGILPMKHGQDGHATKKKVILLEALTFSIFLSGCVERKLTINSKPQGATVILNDEQIGESPVTVSFNWYGDYYVRLSKSGYETLDTHRMLKGPWYDHFPFDFFAQIMNPNRIVDSYEWTFELSPEQQINRDELIEKAMEIQKQLP